MIQEDLVLEIGFHIASLSPDSPEIHIQQVGSTVDEELACRNLVLGIVSVILITVTCTGQHEKHMLSTQSSLQTTDEFG